MKKILFVLLAMAISLPGFANEVTAPETQEAANIETPSFSIENEDVAKVTEENKNEQTAFDMEAFEKNKKIITRLRKRGKTAVGNDILKAYGCCDGNRKSLARYCRYPCGGGRSLCGVYSEWKNG